MKTHTLFDSGHWVQVFLVFFCIRSSRWDSACWNVIAACVSVYICVHMRGTSADECIGNLVRVAYIM